MNVIVISLCEISGFLLTSPIDYPYRKKIRVVNNMNAVNDRNISARNVINDNVADIQIRKTIVNEKNISSTVSR